MRLNKQTDFAIRVLMYLGVNTNKLSTITDISEDFTMPRNHLMKIVNKLANLEYISTFRGKGGGMELKMKSEEIRLGQVMRDFEATAESVIECSTMDCPLVGKCELKGILSEAELAFTKVLDKYTLQNLLESPHDIRRIIGLDSHYYMPPQLLQVS